MASSASGAYKVGIQSAKGAAATAFICGRMERSQLIPVPDDETAVVEHFCGSGTQRPTAVKSVTNRTGYLVAGGGRMFFYPDMFGNLLIGAGFESADTDNTTHDTHVFTIAQEAGWLSVMQYVPVSSGSAYTTKATDCRITSVEVAADTGSGLFVNHDLQGIAIGEALGSETETDETGIKMLPSKGSATITIGATTLTQTLPGYTFRINNPVNTDDRALFQLQRGSLDQSGIDINGVLQGVKMTRDIFREVFNSDASLTTISETPVIADIDVTFQSRSNISGAAVPYSCQFDTPRTQIKLLSYELSGDSQVTTDLEWQMIDDGTVAEPCTITLINGVTAY